MRSHSLPVQVSRAPLLVALAATCAMALLPAPGRAADAGRGLTTLPAPVVQVGASEQSVARRIDMTMGRSLVVDLPRDAKEVFVANPKVANAVVRSTRKLFIIGMENGATSIFVMDAEGRQIAALDVTVGRDLNVLRQTLQTALPQARIEVKPAGDSILMTGTVSSASDAQQAVDIANAFVGITNVGGGAAAPGGSTISKGAVINGLTVRGKDQVMLRVTVVEVARTVLKQFGINSSAGWTALSAKSAVDPATGLITPSNLTSNNPFPLSQAVAPVLSGSMTRGGLSLAATLQAFERAGISRVLAEPNLTAISGESAKFFAGGQIPVPATQSCTPGLGCTIGLEFKDYGVTLDFTPVVLSENRISLRIGTNVTEIDRERQFTLRSGTGNETVAVPGLKVRKSETTVELPSGGSLMTAGLIQQVSRQAINGTPGLINLPILGALFRSRDYQREETELMIIVTPAIAKPLDPGQVARPDDGFVDAHDAQAILLGRLNRLYGVAGAPPPAAYKGRFGFIAD